jgi:hypothetical protein
MLPLVQQAELELFKELSEQKKNSKNNIETRFRTRIVKEQRLIPLLIFNIEAFERTVVALNTLHKTKIVQSFHRSTARDFRIQMDELESALDQVTSNNDKDSSEKDSSIEEDDLSAADRTTMSLVISNGTLQ